VRRTIFTDEHEQFPQMVRTFLAKEYRGRSSDAIRHRPLPGVVRT
jgi:hypothetical protein